MSTYDELIKKTKLKLFTKELLLFGILSNKFEWSISKFSESAEGYVQFNINDPSKLESGVIHINDFFVSKPDYTYNNLAFLICHELLHIINKHGIRLGDRIPELFNIAGDHCIEVFLQQLSDIIKPYNNNYNIIDELRRQKPKCHTEDAYNWLLKNRPKVGFKKLDDLSTEVTIKNTDGSETQYIIINNIGIKGTESEEKLKEILTEQFLAESRAIFENIKTAGNLPNNIKEYIQKLLRVEIPWETLVEKSIKTNVEMKPDDRSWHNINKYYINQKLTLPGTYYIESSEGVGTLIIGVDTSASINSDNLKRFAYIIEKSMTYFKTILLFTHDVTIHQTHEFTHDNISSFQNFLVEEGFTGRGGTSHKYLFDEINTLWEKDKDELSMVICLTDCYSDIEHIYKNYNWIKNKLPLTFVITKNGNELILEKDFGSILQIPIN
ncbi:MAG: VWA-like domain-containing protein [Sphaerochaetaceae bacterium]|nr:VWA-like domain-containing protein [Sphaerochaetaceae bacterium]